VRQSQQMLVAHAQRLLGGLRFDPAGGSSGASTSHRSTPARAAPLAWLGMSSSDTASRSGRDTASASSGSQNSKQQQDARARDQSSASSSDQTTKRRFPLSAKQREEQLKQEAAGREAASLLGSGKGVVGGGGGQMLVAAATTAATTLIAAASSSLPGNKQQQQQQPVDPQPPASTTTSSSKDGEGGVRRNLLRHRRGGEGAREDAAADVVCIEAMEGGRKRVYRARFGFEDGQHWHGFDMLEDEQTHQGRLKELVRSYLLPQGFPESVAPQYAAYMGWRGVQYFFGGAMSVFTTKCLLGALGVAGRHSVSGRGHRKGAGRCDRVGCVGLGGLF